MSDTPNEQSFILNSNGEYQPLNKTIKHGYYATYSNHGCRCNRCKEAHAAWHRMYRQSDSGRERTVKANRKSRRIQQKAADFLRSNYPEHYAKIVEAVNESLND